MSDKENNKTSFRSQFRNSLKKSSQRFSNSDLYKQMSTYLWDTWFLIKKNWKVILPFLLVFSVFNIVVSDIIMQFIQAIALRVTGLNYVGPDNLKQFFKHPVTLILFLIFLIVVCFLHIIEISGIMHVYSLSNIGKKSTLKGIIVTGIMSGVRAFHPKNWTIIPFIIVLIPLTGFFSLSFSSFQAVIPGFVREYIESNALYSNLYLALYSVMLIIEIIYIFSMNFFILSEDSFPMSCRKSRRLISGRKVRTVIALLLIIVIFSLIVTSASSLFSAIITKALTFFSIELTTADANRLSFLTRTTNNFLGLILSPGVNIAALTALFFEYIEEKEMLASLSRNAFNDRVLDKKAIVIPAVIIAVLFISNMFLNPGVWTLRHSRAIDNLEIVAHRGDAANAPDNTYPAFELAVLENADWIELDVQQTKDKVILVSHDDGISRISGMDLYIHDLTYEETQQIDVGSFFDEDFSYVRLSTLDEVLKLCKDKVPVMVEIKDGAYNDHIEEAVLKIINDNGMHDQTLIIANYAPILKRIKELDPTMRTCYTMFVAFSDIGSIPYVDYYTVEESNIDTQIVNGVHEHGGKVYAWTINNADSVQYLIDCGVDGILTDNPTLMKKIIPDARYDQGILRILRLYLDSLSEY